MEDVNDFEGELIVLADELDNEVGHDNNVGYYFNIGGCIYFVDELDSLFKSTIPKDVEHLKSLFKEIIEEDHTNAFIYFMSHGYKIGVMNDQGQTAAHLAFYNDAKKILHWKNGLLLDICDENVNYTDRHGLSHLHIACIVGNLGVVKQFLANNENVNEKFKLSDSDHCGYTPLHFAVINHRIEIVNLLLAHGADLKAEDQVGETPLHAICRVSEKFSELLVKDLTKQPTWNTELDILKLLLESGSDPNKPDRHGNTAFLCLFEDEYYRNETRVTIGYDVKQEVKDDMINDLRIRQKEKFDLILEYGGDVTAANTSGDNILHSTINDLWSLRMPYNHARISFDDGVYSEIIEKVLDALKSESCPEFYINKKNLGGKSPLLLAITYMSPTIVGMLLDRGASLYELELDYTESDFFYYPKIVPNMQAVQNVIKVIELLVDEGYSYPVEDNFAVLKFLVHDTNDCQCGNVNEHVTQFNICNFINYGSPTHTKRMFEKVINTLSIENKWTLKGMMLVFVKEQLLYREKAQFPVDKDILRLIEDIPIRTDDLGELNVQLEEEINAMKEFKLNDSTSLYDVMIKHPHTIYSQIKDFECDQLPDKIEIYKDIIRGHITRSLIRHYVENSVYEYSMPLLRNGFPDVCLKKILSYLTNEDILKLCEAAIIELYS